jgi:hypothetical protein
MSIILKTLWASFNYIMSFCLCLNSFFLSSFPLFDSIMVTCFDKFVCVLQNATQSEDGRCPVKHSLCILIPTDPSSSLSVVYDVKLMHVSHVVNAK